MTPGADALAGASGPGAGDVVTAVVAFTDLVDSTALRTRLGDTRAEGLRQAHDACIRRVVATHGGRLVKHTGDGFLLEFPSAASAVAASRRIHTGVGRQAARLDAVMTVRVGISAGDVHREHGDLFGLPVVEAARLCAHADGGQTLVSDVVRVLLGTGTDAVRPAGSRQLKGIDDPIAVHEVIGTRPVPTLPLPPWLEVVESHRPVGRDDELARLRVTWLTAMDGGRRCTLIGGEAGIGKTHLVATLARELRDQGVTVLGGHCDDAVPAPLLPIIDAVTHGLDHRTEQVGAALEPRFREVLARLVDPATGGPPETIDPLLETELRHRAVEALLDALAADDGVLVVLEDLHWADPGTLLLLRHLALHPGLPGVMVVGTYRPDERHEPLDALLERSRTMPAVEHVLLDGLDEGALPELADAFGGPTLDPADAKALFDQTDGNPLFARELLAERLPPAGSGPTWGDSDGTVGRSGAAPTAVPNGVREMLSRRLRRLPPPTRRLLSVAALMGRDFELDLLAEAVELDVEAALDALDPALSTDLVRESVPIGTLTFTQSLVRAVLVDELGGLQRARWHRRVALALEAHRSDRLDALAHHFTAAGDVDRAVAYSVRAAEQVRTVPEAAAELLERAVATVDSHDVDDPALLVGLLARLAWNRGATGEAAAAQAAIDRAVEVAGITGDPRLLAQAVEPSVNLIQFGQRNDHLRRPVCAVLDHLPPGDSPERVMALALRAHVDAVSAETGQEAQQALADAEAAAAMAARLDDPAATWMANVALGNSLYARSEPARALEVARRVTRSRHPRASGGQSAFGGRLREAISLLQLGRRAEMEDALADVLERSGVTPGGWYGAVGLQLRAALALADGSLVEARRLANRAVGLMDGHPNFALGHQAQQWAMALEGDRIHLRELDAVAAVSPFSWVRALTVLVRAVSGDRDGARAGVTAWFRTGDGPDIPANSGRAPVLRALSESAALLDDAELAERLLPLVEPFSGQLLIGWTGVFCDGAADRALGQLLLALGHPASAVDQLQRALQLEEGFGAAALAARTRVWLGVAQRTAGRGGAEANLDRAAEVAAELGLDGLRRLVTSVGGDDPSGGGRTGLMPPATLLRLSAPPATDPM